ncbi:MAG: hypothetical protein KKC76_00540 [Proteobacteria bacterium]|nr:hypothetical protein [Pseudomonadota bacterium]MBU4297020.1 hypothetical protein [Pseudomonadota bacterium]MCG2749901.1 hypothetical protein [Desulfobulbaceae bacterium]
MKSLKEFFSGVGAGRARDNPVFAMPEVAGMARSYTKMTYKISFHFLLLTFRFLLKRRLIFVLPDHLVRMDK